MSRRIILGGSLPPRSETIIGAKPGELGKPPKMPNGKTITEVMSCIHNKGKTGAVVGS